MRKTFPLAADGKHPERLIEATKHEIRKYLKRERRRDLPEGMDYWAFDCSFGLTQDEAQPVHVAALTERIDEAGSLLHIRLPREAKMPALARLATLGETLRDLQVHEPSHEDVFFGYRN